jgi:hypothetical protein
LYFPALLTKLINRLPDLRSKFDMDFEFISCEYKDLFF